MHKPKCKNPKSKRRTKTGEETLAQYLTTQNYGKRLTNFTQTNDVLCNTVHTFHVAENISISSDSQRCCRYKQPQTQCPFCQNYGS